MQTKKVTATMISAIIFIACNNNPSTNASAVNDNTGKQAATADPAYGSVSGSGSDMFYEYKLSTTSNEMSIQSDTKMYVASEGDMRVEMSTTTSYKGKNSSALIVTIGRSDKPNESISIDDSAKTYSVNHFSDSDFNAHESIKSTVQKIGEEKILGFNSVHARIISNKNMGGFYNDVDTIDLWKGNDVPMPASVKELFDKFEAKTGNSMYSTDAVNQLKQLGCTGFLTKMEIHSKRSSTAEELVKVERRDLSTNMFRIPTGYTESKDGM